MLPHAYAVAIIKSSNNGRWDNSNPRSPAWNEKIHKTTPSDIFGRFERAEAAHKNGMESLAIFCTSVILGNIAELPANKLNAVAGLYLASRAIYNIVYIGTTSHKYSYIRTGVWLSSISLCLYQIMLAGNVLASRSNR